MDKEELPDIYKLLDVKYGCSDFRLRNQAINKDMGEIKNMKTWEATRLALQICGQEEKKREYDWRYLEKQTKDPFITRILWGSKHGIFKDYYLILEKLGEASMGEEADNMVHLATEDGRNEYCCIKKMMEHRDHFQDVNEAWAILKNKEYKNLYDGVYMNYYYPITQ